MFQIVRHIDFSYGHRLLEHPGKCLHLHGHNGRAEVVLQADSLDGHAMVADFGEVKRGVKGWIDDHLDHRMILQRTDPMVPVLLEAGEPIYLTEVAPTAEAIARIIFEAAREAGFPVREVRLWETPDAQAVYAP